MLLLIIYGTLIGQRTFFWCFFEKDFWSFFTKKSKEQPTTRELSFSFFFFLEDLKLLIHKNRVNELFNETSSNPLRN